jgi:uncharacterized protein (DUF433 family)
VGPQCGVAGQVAQCRKPPLVCVIDEQENQSNQSLFARWDWHNQARCVRRKTMNMNFKPYITRDPSICGGEPVITGTRITVRTILASLAEGMSTEEILLDFPTLSRDAVRAVVAFAAVSAEEDLPFPATPVLA